MAAEYNCSQSAVQEASFAQLELAKRADVGKAIEKAEGRFPKKQHRKAGPPEIQEITDLASDMDSSDARIRKGGAQVKLANNICESIYLDGDCVHTTQTVMLDIDDAIQRHKRWLAILENVKASRNNGHHINNG